MNMLQSGLAWLAAKQKKHASSRVVYIRDGKRYSVDAILGSTKYDIVDETGFKISGHAIDFLIRAVDLPLVPESGDQIVADGIVHEVADLGDGFWRWCDPHGITRRIHTNLFKDKK
ncbi:MAG TPA: hypothetical protein DEB39_12150 [Planctomycetaceae bacterium]|nr:hypothetical protein [Planctomycetaceae bacterium]